MSENRINELIHKLLHDNCTPQEKQELFLWVAQTKDNEELKKLLENAWQHYNQPLHTVPDDISADVLQTILSHGKVAEMHPARTRTRRLRIVAAASVILLMGIGSYFLFINKPAVPTKNIAASIPHDIKAPQTSRAIITLSNGKQIVLDSAGNGRIATQGNISVTKLAEGQVAYNGASPLATSNSPLAFNTLTNPRGSKVVSLTLSDGTKVWLNAESALTYPAEFAGSERKVTVTGEAYFEVAHKSAMPFKVQKGDVEVQVIGTHFNINAYDDETDIKITLLEGAVKVMQKTAGKMLKPGEQAVASRYSPLAIYHSPDLNEVMAWKNGYFSFKDADITTLMRQLTRWYDIDVRFEGKISNELFTGKISRNLMLKDLFEGLAAAKVHYRIEEERKIVILP